MTICVTFLYTKSKTLYVTRFFIKNSSWHLYRKSMTVCATWRFYIQKARHFAKSKTICVTFLCTKSGHFVLRDFSLNFWNWLGGGHFNIQKTMHFGLHFYMQKTMHFALRFLYTKSLTLCVAFLYAKNNALWVTFLYAKNDALCFTFLYSKSLTLCVEFLYPKNTAFCLRFLYLKFIV